MGDLRFYDGGCHQVSFTAGSHQIVEIRDAPIDMAMQCQRRKRACRRVPPRKNRPDLSLKALAGLLENQATAGENSVAKMGGGKKETGEIGRMKSGPTDPLR
ncbi:MAG: hypothetical protein ABSA23_01035 [Anaerolineales bacterium]|jgi:hypothetical protein